MKDKVIERLVSFGYLKAGEDAPAALSPVDEIMIDFIIEKVERQIKEEINDTDIPVEFMPSAVDMIVGEFFLSKKNLGQLTMDDIDFSDTVKTLREGDTEIVFADGGSTAEMVDALINCLVTPKVPYSDFRRIRW